MSPARMLVPPGLALIGVTYGLARFAYGLFLPAIREDVALTPTLAGLIGGGSYAGYCLAIIASALLSDRLGPRNTAVLAGLVAAAGMACIAFAPTAILLAAAVLFAGMSTGLASPPLADAVAMRIVPARQDRANTLINCGTSAGVALSGPIALAYAGAWREAYLLSALLAVCVTVWIWRTLPARAPERDPAGRVPALQAIWRPAAGPLVLAAFGMGVASAAYWTFAAEVMVDVGGLPGSIASMAWVVIGLAGFAGGATGDLVRRFGLSAVNRASLLTLAAAVLTTGLLPGSALVVFAAAASFGAAYIMLTGVHLVWGLRVFVDRPALGLGLAFLMIALGQIAGALLAGVTIGALGHASAFALFALVALATMLVRPARRERRTDGPSAAGAAGGPWPR
jgi:predicted MFS family arabinose efflux permease